MAITDSGVFSSAALPGDYITDPLNGDRITGTSI